MNLSELDIPFMTANGIKKKITKEKFIERNLSKLFVSISN